MSGRFIVYLPAGETLHEEANDDYSEDMWFVVDDLRIVASFSTQIEAAAFLKGLNQ